MQLAQYSSCGHSHKGSVYVTILLRIQWENGCWVLGNDKARFSADTWKHKACISKVLFWVLEWPSLPQEGCVGPGVSRVPTSTGGRSLLSRGASSCSPWCSTYWSLGVETPDCLTCLHLRCSVWKFCPCWDGEHLKCVQYSWDISFFTNQSSVILTELLFFVVFFFTKFKRKNLNLILLLENY